VDIIAEKSASGDDKGKKTKQQGSRQPLEKAEKSPCRTLGEHGAADEQIGVLKAATVADNPAAGHSQVAENATKEGDLRAEATTKQPKAAKKARATPKSRAGTKEATASRVRKPRKVIKKSESIILNSDDPEEMATADTEAVVAGKDDSAVFIEGNMLPAEEAHEHILASNMVRENERDEQTVMPLTSDLPYDEVSVHFQKLVKARRKSSVSLKREPVERESGHPTAIETLPETIIAKAAKADDPATPQPNHCSRSLLAAIEGFGHNTDDATIQRLETGESSQKRRRIDFGEDLAVEHVAGEPSDVPTTETVAKVKSTKATKKAKADKPVKAAKVAKTPAAPKVRKPRAEKVAKPPKTPKPKKPKTKAMTITDLVTSAFRPLAEETAEAGTVSSFFTPRLEPANPDVSDAQQSASTIEPAKTKTPRVPLKVIDPHQTIARKVKPSSAVKPKKRKPKVKSNEDNHTPELLVPEMARAIEKSQGFLFGTSSQLAAEESPSFIRDMQMAIEQSEAFLPPSLHTSRTGTLLQRIRAASHSPEKAPRGMWREAARDREGGLQACGRRRRVKGSFAPRATEPVAESVGLGDDIPHAEAQVTAPRLNPQDDSAVEPCRQLPEVSVQCADIAGVQALCDSTSDLLAAREVPLAVVPDDAMDAGVIPPESVSSNRLKDPPISDDWMLLSSDPTVEEEPATIISADRDQNDNFEEQIRASQMSQPRRLPWVQDAEHIIATGSQNTSALSREPLRNLDRNVSPSKIGREKKMIEKQVKQPVIAVGLENAESSSAPTTKPRGRPKKSELSTTSTTRRGRLKKGAAATISAAEAMPPLTTASSQPERPVASQWMVIDEISDSDAPVTPSPPRLRRTVSSPPTILPLPLSLPSSPRRAEVPTLLHPILNATDAAWPSVRESLFPKITKLVKSTPPSTEMNMPTWHEKMLLFDPIVLEDLTAWLTEQGLRYELHRPKPKAKTKVAKSSKKATEDIEPEADANSNLEIVQEEVKPWMVQRWCEEKSICCLWKEGLRGGVKVKY
jgi:hypothetical protein